jgi:hypothetical protein
MLGLLGGKIKYSAMDLYLMQNGIRIRIKSNLGLFGLFKSKWIDYTKSSKIACDKYLGR